MKRFTRFMKFLLLKCSHMLMCPAQLLCILALYKCYSWTTLDASWNFEWIKSPGFQNIVRGTLGFPCGSPGKGHTCNAGDLGSIPGFDPWVGKIPWRREKLATPVSWAREFHGWYSPWVQKESDMTEWLSLSLRIIFHYIWNLFYKWVPREENFSN